MLRKQSLKSVAEELFQGENNDSYQAADMFSNMSDLRQSSRSINNQGAKQPGFFTRIWQRFRGKGRQTKDVKHSRTTSMLFEKTNQPLLGDSADAESQSTFDKENVFAPMPDFLTFTSK